MTWRTPLPLAFPHLDPNADAARDLALGVALHDVQVERLAGLDVLRDADAHAEADRRPRLELDRQAHDVARVHRDRGDAGIGVVGQLQLGVAAAIQPRGRPGAA